MGDLDMKKQLEEAAAERSSIAQALLGIQSSLDQIAPTVAQTQPTLAALEPVVQDLAAWRPSVEAAVGQLRANPGDLCAHLEKMALGAARMHRDVPSSDSATADAPGSGGGFSGDCHGLFSHRGASSSRGPVINGPLLPSPVLANAKLLDWGEDGVMPETEVAIQREMLRKELDHPNVTKFVGASMGTTDLNIPAESGQCSEPTDLPERACCVVF